MRITNFAAEHEPEIEQHDAGKVTGLLPLPKYEDPAETAATTGGAVAAMVG
jgi:hypothetical protein